MLCRMFDKVEVSLARGDFREIFKKTAINYVSSKSMRGVRKDLGEFQALLLYCAFSEGDRFFQEKLTQAARRAQRRIH